jgi:hypothetical protein
MRCTPVEVHAHKIHACKVHADEIHAHQMHAYEIYARHSIAFFARYGMSKDAISYTNNTS